MWCGVVWCGVVWCGVVWCGVVWCGVVWCGVVVWCGGGVVCCVLLYVRACVYRKTQENETKRVTERDANVVITVWENTEMVRNIGVQFSKHGLLLGTIWSTTDQKTSENGLSSRRIVFTLPLGFTDVFG